jgi:hypothetical protein
MPIGYRLPEMLEETGYLKRHAVYGEEVGHLPIASNPSFLSIAVLSPSSLYSLAWC